MFEELKSVQYAKNVMYKGKKNYSVGIKICRSQPLQGFVRDFKTIRFPFLKYRRKIYV